MNKEEILTQLQQFRKDDISWRDGRLWSYVYYLDKETEEIGKLAYTEYLTENGIDGTAFSSLRKMENEVIHFCREILRGDENVVGTMTTGGTESILLAVKTARDRAKALNPSQQEFEMILPETVHAAFYKAAHYFGVKAITVKVDDNSYKATVELIQPHINPNTILIAASAMSYAYGVVDEIESIGKLALGKNISFHVDGCIGAFILSTAREGGYAIEDFDFTVPGVTSISMDLHKYAYCPKGASVVLYRNAELRAEQYFACAGWTGYTMINPTILSSKSGGAVAAAWATLHAFGERGYLDAARSILEARRAVVRGIEAIDGLRVLGRPESSLVAFTTEGGASVFHVADEMA